MSPSAGYMLRSPFVPMEMPKLPFLLSVLAACVHAGDLELKYNLVGAVIPHFAEHAVELEYTQNDFLVPFMRFSLLDREYDHESWSGEKVGETTEDGFLIFLGNKFHPFPWRFAKNLEIPLYFRYAKTQYEHVGMLWVTGRGKEKVKVNSIGTGLSFNATFGRWLVVEPFWYADYGHYDINMVSGDTGPNSPYHHRWDDEHRVGLNVGLKLGH